MGRRYFVKEAKKKPLVALGLVFDEDPERKRCLSELIALKI
jgi:hypothetical protein